MGRRKRGWNAAAGLSLHDLRRMLEEKEGAISSLAARRNALADELAEVEAELAASGGAVRRGPGRPPGRRGPGRPKGSGRRGPGRPKGSRRGKPGRPRGKKGQSDLHNAIRAVLKGSAEPMKLVDVAEKV